MGAELPVEGSGNPGHHRRWGGGAEDSEGTVDFTARFKLDGRNEAHREIALFRKDGERWFYVEGQIGGPKQEQRRVAVKAGRNDPCPAARARSTRSAVVPDRSV